MEASPISSIAEVTQRVSFPDLDFADPETSIEDIVDRLYDAAMYFNLIAITDFGGKEHGIRAKGLLEGAVGSPFQSFGGVEMYQDPFEKAGALFRGIVQGHPFNDANKRTGFLTASYYLEKMGYPLPEDLHIDEVYDFCERASKGEIKEIEDIIQKIRYFWHADKLNQEVNSDLAA